jgi:hypothetical protein
LSLLCAGCVSIESYPKSWDSLDTGEPRGCSHVTGAYSDAGEVPSGKITVSLTRWLFDDTLLSQKPTSVAMALSQDGSLLQIRVRDGEGTMLERELRLARSEFSCDGGLLRIPRTKGTNREGVVAFQSGSIELFRAKGNLVVKSSGGGAGIMLLLPVIAYGTNYARFPRLD